MIKSELYLNFKYKLHIYIFKFIRSKYKKNEKQ